MQLKNKKLLIFMFKLIDIQIKKYIKLTQIGVGPDAEINARLVVNAVNDLLKIANTFFDKVASDTLTDQIYDAAYSQVKLYIDGEDLRSRAGWLIDSNNIHNSLASRLEDQKKELKKIAEIAEVKTTEFIAKTDAQFRYKFDSHAIAHLILDSAIKLMQDPNAALPNIPSHAEKIMRKHAIDGGRYQQKEFKEEIQTLHEQCKKYINSVAIKKSKKTITLEEAKAEAEHHRAELQNLLGYFDACVPERDKSKYFDWYDVNRSVEPKKVESYFNCNSTLFKIGVAATVATVAMTAVYRL